MISYKEAYRLTLEHIQPLSREVVPIFDSLGRIPSEDLDACVDSPSADVSLKDGFAVLSQDIEQATLQNPVSLTLVGNASAGNPWDGKISSGETIGILSGAVVPLGANAVLSEEFASMDGSRVTPLNDAAPGRNILRCGVDVNRGQLLSRAGEVLIPTLLGLLAAAGYDSLRVVRRPRVAILAIDDEVVAPGLTLKPGKLYAGNLVTLSAWCQRFGFETTTQVLPDDEFQL
jgi:molybdopterin molybdotransferase